jgi:hypothetical protein
VEEKTKVRIFQTVFIVCCIGILVSMFLVADLIRKTHAIPKESGWEIEAIKMRDGNELYLGKGWEIFDYDPERNVVYVKRRKAGDG